ncbi:unnamed protein product, partial [Urochloa humidicola]
AQFLNLLTILLFVLQVMELVKLSILMSLRQVQVCQFHIMISAKFLLGSEALNEALTAEVQRLKIA